MTSTVDPATGAALTRESTRSTTSTVTVSADPTSEFTLVELRALVDAARDLPGLATVQICMSGEWRIPQAISVEHRESESLDDSVLCPVCDGSGEYPGDDCEILTCEACKGGGRAVVAW
jgi:hypothetical protein